MLPACSPTLNLPWNFFSTMKQTFYFLIKKCLVTAAFNYWIS